MSQEIQAARNLKPGDIVRRDQLKPGDKFKHADDTIVWTCCQKECTEHPHSGHKQAPFKCSRGFTEAWTLPDNPCIIVSLAAESFPRPILRKDVRVGDVVSCPSLLGYDAPSEIIEVTNVRITRNDNLAHTIRNDADRIAPLLLHSRKDSNDASELRGSTEWSAKLKAEIGNNSERGKPDESLANDNAKDVLRAEPICRGDIPVKPTPEGFRKQWFGGTRCIMPDGWHYTPKQPPQKRPEDSTEMIGDKKYRIKEAEPYYLKRNDDDIIACTPLDQRIKQHLEARKCQ